MSRNLTLDWKFTFGKHKGKSINEVSGCQHTYSYCLWCYQNVDWFKELLDKNEPLKNTIMQRFKHRQRVQDEHEQACAYTNTRFE